VTGAVVGVEALARWARPQGLVSPAEFIPVAEESGLIVPLGARVLDLACREAAVWNAVHPHAPLTVAVNLSAHQLGTDVTGLVGAALDEAGLDPAHLCLELTESALMDDADAVGATLLGLKELGVRVGVDDFGTGYSSLLYLRRFPIDVLKIDRSFVNGMNASEADAAIVAAVIGLAHALGLEAIAEGVETGAQETCLAALGCDLAQGYHWARPMDAARLWDWLEGRPAGVRLAG
jgi:EAL domain-containing protein (putative c-di-GMP-specific phosphodiesterase class I)